MAVALERLDFRARQFLDHELVVVATFAVFDHNNNKTAEACCAAPRVLHHFAKNPMRPLSSSGRPGGRTYLDSCYSFDAPLFAKIAFVLASVLAAVEMFMLCVSRKGIFENGSNCILGFNCILPCRIRTGFTADWSAVSPRLPTGEIIVF